MFALKKLRIPLPGRHLPSPSLSDASVITGSGPVNEEPLHLGQPTSMLNSLQSLRLKPPNQKASSAMSTLQKYYGLKSQTLERASEGMEMAVYRTENSNGNDDGLFLRTSVLSMPPPNIHPKNRKYAGSFFPENDSITEHLLLAEPGDGESEKSDEKLVRRRQKTEVDNGIGTPERLLKGENSGGGYFSAASNGKGLAMRPKSVSRSMLLPDTDPVWINSIPVGLGDAIITDGISEVHKSSSTSNLRDQDSNNSASVWPTTKWSLKPDLQALSSVAISKPLFDGLPNPITGRRNKAALD
ncbi:uncharacterized protein LOC111009048 isoform X2 [Momordica charantia]|nr:uncharacterized protein LOC111009048 isoform X2 [Momordica charantia]XP_022137659.1 uncharacterized protein LOC111009048 isoform X2 [Momordica charantia]XP_022137660.1 uncharacterized protein LOC111009048 isoform X2 [Momordica charantia]XP_022137661.1 uncharacterized protein LOC111009048 isoform X2 [Momordica charantia]